MLLVFMLKDGLGCRRFVELWHVEESFVGACHGMEAQDGKKLVEDGW